MFTSGYLTAKNAQEVAEHLATLADNPHVAWIQLHLVRYRVVSGVTAPTEEHETFWVQLDTDRHVAPTVDLVNNGTLVLLRTREGKQIDLYFSRPEERTFSPAFAQIGGSVR